MGIVDDLGVPTTPQQRYEDPPRAEFGRFANHFGKVRKVFFILADSLKYDFQRLAPLDFAFIDGAHDLKHIVSDTRHVYDTLSANGCITWHDFDSATPWVAVRRALQKTDFPETIYHVSGTEVAFLLKQGWPRRGERSVRRPRTHKA
jgi:hypothetical protein